MARSRAIGLEFEVWWRLKMSRGTALGCVAVAASVLIASSSVLGLELGRQLLRVWFQSASGSGTAEIP